MNRRYHTRVITNIIYSAIISCLVEIFLVTNVSMIARYMEESGRMNGLIQAVLGYHVAVVLVYVISGLVLFAVTFMILQEPYIRYISKISDAVQSISEGNLNTTIDVIGDDEFSSMAANLNKMVEDIRVLMDKERESERTKNELITNVAHEDAPYFHHRLSGAAGRQYQDTFGHAAQVHRDCLWQGKAPGKTHRRPVWVHKA